MTNATRQRQVLPQTFVVVNAGDMSARFSFHSLPRNMNGFLPNNRAFSLLYCGLNGRRETNQLNCFEKSLNVNDILTLV